MLALLTPNNVTLPGCMGSALLSFFSSTKPSAAVSRAAWASASSRSASLVNTLLKYSVSSAVPSLRTS